MPFYVPTTDIGLLRATGTLAPPLMSTVRVETAGTSGYQYLTQGIRAETETVIAIQQRGDLETSASSQKGDYVQVREIVNDPSGSYEVVRLMLDNGGGVGARISIPTSETGSALTEEERELSGEQPEPQEPTSSEKGWETITFFQPFAPDTPQYQAPETQAPIAQPEPLSLPQEQAPPAGCETRLISRLVFGNTVYYHEHDAGGGNWT